MANVIGNPIIKYTPGGLEIAWRLVDHPWYHGLVAEAGYVDGDGNVSWEKWYFPTATEQKKYWRFFSEFNLWVSNVSVG